MRVREHHGFGHGLRPGTSMDINCTSCQKEKAAGQTPVIREQHPAAATDAEWLYGDSPAGLRMRAAEDLAVEFGTDVEEWLV